FISSPLLYTILISIITRELSTLLTALYLISRSGAAIATELGNMVLNEEVDALISIGISPFTYLVIPRLIGVVISLFVLSIYFNIFGLIGSAFLTQYLYDLPFSTFITRVFNELTLTDVFSSSIKAIVFGFFIAIISCFHGLKVSGSITEVPQRTSKAVVQSIGVIIIIDIIITLLFYA
ncbi:MAG TPA: ABC transporter permease, partial [Melioribacteraceae bacterium]|nr:ABC transporter permease [Melioribacteraceae bacterium]